MKIYIYLLIGLVVIIIGYFIFAKMKANATLTGTQDNPVTNTGTGKNTILDWITVLTPWVVEGGNVYIATHNKGGGTGGTQN